MNRFIAVLLLSVTSAFANFTVEAGYRQNDITFGALSSDQGAYVLGLEGKFDSFRLAAVVQNNATLNSTSLYQTDFIAGYTFASTLVDVEVGGNMVIQGKPSLLDFGTHWRPFITFQKSWYYVRGTMDIESKTTNVEAALRVSHKLVGGLTGLPLVYVGYTDVNDAFPKSIREVKYTNAYFGGSYDVKWKFLSAGVYVLKTKGEGSWVNGWRAGITQQF